MQCRGASGLSLGAVVIRTSVPHKLHRYSNLTFLSSPAGGGSGGEVISILKIINPTQSNTIPITMAISIFRKTKATQTSAPIKSTLRKLFLGSGLLLSTYVAYVHSQMSRVPVWKSS